MMQDSSLFVELRSSKSIPSLYTLPVEVLYRILDQLEGRDIVFSFRNVCTKFYAITNIYNRLTIELSNYHSSKVETNRLCRIIEPENVASLIFWKSYTTSTFDEIDWFFSSIDIHRFTRLCFLNITNIKDRHLHTILHHLTTISTLISLKIYDRSLMNDNIIADLSAIIALPSLRILDLDISCIIIDKLSWPNHCKLRQMNTRKCSHKKWCQILHHSPYLRRFSTVYFDMNNIDNIVRSTSYQQLTSLTLSDIRFSIDQLEILLLPLSSLVYFDLRANENTSFSFLQRFSQWEYFIKDKLPLLEQFYFHISILISHYRDLNYIESIISAFRTPFWLEYKRWYATFQHVINNEISQIILKSSINTNTDLFEDRYHGSISYFTYTTKNDSRLKMSSVWNARFNFSWLMMHPTSKLKQPNYLMFNKWNQLVLDINDYLCWQMCSFELLSKLINLSQLNEIWLFISCRENFDPKVINTLLEQASNVHTLGITHNGVFTSIIENVCSVLTHQIDHFKVRLTYINYMKLILERVEHLSTVTFINDWRLLSHQTEMIEWLNEKQRKFSIANDYQSLQVWFNKNTIESSEIETKLPYLIDHQHDL